VVNSGGLRPIELLAAGHRLERFDSGVAELDRWLRNSAHVGASAAASAVVQGSVPVPWLSTPSTNELQTSIGTSDHHLDRGCLWRRISDISAALGGRSSTGVGNQWWYQMTAADFYACQLPDSTGGVTKPPPW
jgi:hypothetical protein